MERYCRQMQKPNNEAEQRGDVWIDEERIDEKEGREGERD